ncbi:T9SS type A sorting domain-containing protein [Chryseobacterium sp. L7]|uniref:T9SS type A sorting domain-containing protein n=1 Tax=Chryseobacterium endalhagicum TaxID=2797638 RepID=A0ABS1QC70_9FLAO|nr:T9SS type A sorting domain-containing protein [Chryseobacterium endalhagicum]MBL1220200.1 T9SS type A sorting domain-containing protein [Chryseobacterium endalhagicum]
MKKIYILLSVSLSLITYAQLFTQTHKITPTERKIADNFGFNIHLRDNVLFSSAAGNNSDSNGDNIMNKAGTFFIFEKENNTWAQKAKLAPPDRAPNDGFGDKFAVDGDDLFISAPYKSFNGNGNVGAVYLYNKNSAGSWVMTQKIMPLNTTGGGFGSSLSADSKILAVGSANEKVSVYEYNSNTHQFGFTQFLLLPNNTNSNNASVFVKGDLIFVGKKDQEINGVFNAGQVNIFKKNSSTGFWEIIQTINSPLPGERQFGIYVYAKDDYLVVTAHLDAFVAIYRYSSTSNSYEHLQNISYNSPFFGRAISMENDILAIAAPGAMNGSLNSGSVQIYRIKENSFWAMDQEIYNSDPAAFDGFGYGVSINNGRIAVGSPHQDLDYAGNNNISQAGAAYIFNTPNNLAVSETVSGGSYKIYPNPFTKTVSVQLEKIHDDLTADVFDLSGRKLYSKNFSKTQLIDLNLDFLAAGTYQISVSSKDKILISSKIIKK